MTGVFKVVQVSGSGFHVSAAVYFRGTGAWVNGCVTQAPGLLLGYPGQKEVAAVNTSCSAVCFFVNCFRVVDVLYNNNFFTKAKVTVFITRFVGAASLFNSPFDFWFSYFIIFPISIDFICPDVT